MGKIVSLVFSHIQRLSLALKLLVLRVKWFTPGFQAEDKFDCTCEEGMHWYLGKSLLTDPS